MSFQSLTVDQLEALYDGAIHGEKLVTGYFQNECKNLDKSEFYNLRQVESIIANHRENCGQAPLSFSDYLELLFLVHQTTEENDE